MNNVKQREVIESFLIKNVKNRNVYQCSVNFEHFTSSILLNNVPYLQNNLNSLENMVRFFYMNICACMLIYLLLLLSLLFYYYYIFYLHSY